MGEEGRRCTQSSGEAYKVNREENKSEGESYQLEGGL